MSESPQACSRQQRGLRLRARLLLLCVVIALAGCTPMPSDSLPPANTVQPTVAGTNLAFTTIAQGDHLSANLVVDKPTIIVIASAQEVDAAMRLAAGDPPTLAMNPHPIN